MFEKNVLHGDLSPNNLIIYEGRGFFIDFDHAQIITQCNDSDRARGTVSSSSKAKLVEVVDPAICRAPCRTCLFVFSIISTRFLI
jgi:tRNA A-37 threonylcarbamoyl transferase component Bud32